MGTIDRNSEEYKRRAAFFDRRMKRAFPDDALRARGVDRAIENQDRFYSLLRSTGLEGIEDLISAIHKSNFSTTHSHSHHHYPTGTMEHSLGVYDLMKASPKAVNFTDTELILVGLLHDVCMGHLDEWSLLPTGHGYRSRCIVEKYLPAARTGKYLEAMIAINFHRKPIPENLRGPHPLRNLVKECDRNDASTCNSGQKF